MDILERAAGDWRNRLLRAESRQAAMRRRVRLCQRRIHQLRGEMTGVRADLLELEQQAAETLQSSDRERARVLSGRIRDLDHRLRSCAREMCRLEHRQQRLELMERCWEWRADQHRRAGSLRRERPPSPRGREDTIVTGGAIRVR